MWRALTLVFLSAAFIALSAPPAAALDFLQYESSISDGADTQVRNGQRFENTNYEDLKTYLDEFCQNRSSSGAIGRRVAFVGAIHLSEQFRTCDGDLCLNGLMNPNKPKSIFNLGPGRLDPLFINLNDRYGPMRAAPEYRDCVRIDITSNVFCLVGIYGQIRKQQLNLPAFKGNSRVYLSAGECVVQVSDIVFGAAQNRNSWVLKAAVQGALDPFGNQTGLFGE